MPLWIEDIKDVELGLYEDEILLRDVASANYDDGVFPPQYGYDVISDCADLIKSVMGRLTNELVMPNVQSSKSAKRTKSADEFTLYPEFVNGEINYYGAYRGFDMIVTNEDGDYYCTVFNNGSETGDYGIGSTPEEAARSAVMNMGGTADDDTVGRDFFEKMLKDIGIVCSQISYADNACQRLYNFSSEPIKRGQINEYLNLIADVLGLLEAGNAMLNFYFRELVDKQ